VFSTTSGNKDLDPLTHILYLRTAALRRMIAKHEGQHDIICKIILDIHNKKNATPKTPIIWPAWDDKEEDRFKNNRGPVHLLYENLQQYGYELNTDLTITKYNEAPIDLWRMPWQHLKTAMHNIATRGRLDTINSNRTFCGHIEEIDELIVRKL
jgi:hypothetical protein